MTVSDNVENDGAESCLPAGKPKEGHCVDYKLLASHFRESFGLHNDAINWLLDAFFASQIFDDFADGDRVERSDLDHLIHVTLVKMPTNPFYRANDIELSSVLSNVILKWHASDVAEREGGADEVSFVWRAAFYDLVLPVVRICRGVDFARDNAVTVLKMYGETFESYKAEFCK